MAGKKKKKGRSSLRAGADKRKTRKEKDPPPFHNPFIEVGERLKDSMEPKEPVSEPMAAFLRPAPSTPSVSAHEEDLRAFEQEMSNVEPLDTRPERMPLVGLQPKVAAAVSEDAEVLAQLADLVSGAGPFDIADTTEYVEGIAPGQDKRLLERLKRGDFSVQSHLDLHGFTRDEACKAVADYLKMCRTSSLRCVLLVHGRGLHSKDREPVLKNQLARWLSRGPMSRNILAFCTARSPDGGGGSLYVLLRK